MFFLDAPIHFLGLDLPREYESLGWGAAGRHLRPNAAPGRTVLAL